MRTLSLFLALAGLASAQSQSPLSLDEALASAERHHPSLAASQGARDAGQARFDQARLDRLGRVDASVAWNPNVQNPTFPIPGGPSLTLPLVGTHTFGVQIDQPLWTWNRLRGRQIAAGREVESLDSRMGRVRQTMRASVRSAYLQVLQCEAAEGVAQEALKQQQAFLGMAQARVRAGSAPRLDVLKAELAVSAAETEAVARRTQVRAARAALVLATGDEALRRQPLAPWTSPTIPLQEEDFHMARALAQRLDLRALDQQIQATALEASAWRSSGLPSLHLVGSLSQQSAPLGGWMGGRSRATHLGVAVRWEGFALPRSRARAAEREAQGREQAAHRRQLQDQVRSEVRNACLGLEDAQAQCALAETALRQAEEQARVARLAYTAGVVTAVEAQDAELALTRARHQKLHAALSRDLAWVALTHAVGED